MLDRAHTHLLRRRLSPANRTFLIPVALLLFLSGCEVDDGGLDALPGRSATPYTSPDAGQQDGIVLTGSVTAAAARAPATR